MEKKKAERESLFRQLLYFRGYRPGTVNIYTRKISSAVDSGISLMGIVSQILDFSRFSTENLLLNLILLKGEYFKSPGE